MQTISLIVRQLRRPFALALLALALFTSASQAAKIHFWVFTKGTWVLVTPGSNTGGRLVWDPAHCRYFTDRAARGEPLDVVFSATVPGEYPRLSGTYASCGNRALGVNCLPYDYFTVVPTNPNCDNNYFWIITSAGYVEERLPIGQRQ